MASAASALATDPVCGMQVDPRRAAATRTHDGVAYHFCSVRCATRFDADPGAFAGRKAVGLPMAGATGAAMAAHGDDDFACPMHPEVRQATPGRCPKCGMALRRGVAPDAAPHGSEEHGTATGWRAYVPLIVVFLLLLAAVAALAWHDLHTGVRTTSWRRAATRFMAGFFLVFAGFKLMDLPGFADGYATYDLLAGKVRPYAYLYPFLELSFGLLMLAGVGGNALLWVEVAVMAFSGVGVAIKLAKKEAFQCSCLGTFLKVPLTKVTLVEDFGMAALALLLLLVH